jgi:hypothetical protein
VGLKKMSATVYLYAKDSDQADTEGPFTVEVRHVDRLQAELRTGVLGIDPEKHQQHLAAAWAWAAMTREKHYSGPLERFLYTDSADVELDTAKDEETGADVEVTPTGPGVPPG